MKKTLLLILFFVCAQQVFATHLKGGWIYYEYLGKGSDTNFSVYRITIKQYALCGSSVQDNVVYLGIFDGATNSLTQTVNVDLSNSITENKKTFDPCINNPPNVCYRIDIYVTTVQLKNKPDGYILAVQRCCRIGGIQNINNSQNEGVTYTTKIPGVVSGVVVRNNNSPRFAQSDTAVICVNSFFTFDFSATDEDSATLGDSLSYVFCNGLTGGSASNAQPNPPSDPPYNSVSYKAGYNGLSPMGPDVTINSLTGIISGTAPNKTGDFVVAVCVYEWRNGIKIGETRKELHITVANCQLAGAQLKPSYVTCDGFSVSFKNESTASNIVNYFWDFGVIGITTDTSTQATPVYTYADTGSYVIKLAVINSNGCKDSARSILQVFPQFLPGFTTIGNCILNPFKFFDTTFSSYGTVNSWQWNFGEAGVTNDTSTKQNPSYSYLTKGTHTVTLITSNTKGCTDTAQANIIVYDKPLLNLLFKDTLICGGDTVQLHSNVNGLTPKYSWIPVRNISNDTIPDPYVYPTNTTTYILNVDDHGCVNSDSVIVNVEQPINANISFHDTTICSIDTLQLNATTNALSPVFRWTPKFKISDVSIANPLIYPDTSTTYYLHIDDNVCSASDSVKINVVKAINVNVAFSDTTICSTDSIQLHASTNAVSPAFSWSPNYNINNAGIANPLVYPKVTTTYVLNVSEQKVCKATDSVKVNVVQAINANISFHDTTICSIDTLQLNAATTALSPMYSWTPDYNISSTSISNPLVYPQKTTTYFLHIDDNVCAAEDSVKVNVVSSITTAINVHDTTICINDTLHLSSSTNAISPVYHWSPQVNISNPNISDPLFYPTDTTVYYLNVLDNVCKAVDSVKINVIKSLNIKVTGDTAICRGDTIQIVTETNGINYLWNPTTGLSNPNIKNPLAFPDVTTTYSLASSVGKCLLSGSVTITVAPLPTASVDSGTTICYGDIVQLHAITNSSFFSWTPSTGLQNSNTLNPFASPQNTTKYLFIARDTLGCPRAAVDSVIIKVIPKVLAFAGHDTSIVINQPLQLNASGGSVYTWSPATFMNDPFIANPVVTITTNTPDTITYRVKVSTPEGCFAFDDIKITIFKTIPEIFVPTGFTPNGDGLNDILKPILVGIKDFRFFRVFNRWGQMIFTTSTDGRGWDGTIGGVKQASGTYIFQVQAVDYLGHIIDKKGTVVLIR